MSVSRASVQHHLVAHITVAGTWPLVLLFAVDCVVLHVLSVQATPAAPANVGADVIEALTKRTQDGGTEVVNAKAGKVWGAATYGVLCCAVLCCAADCGYFGLICWQQHAPCGISPAVRNQQQCQTANTACRHSGDGGVKGVQCNTACWHSGAPMWGLFAWDYPHQCMLC